MCYLVTSHLGQDLSVSAHHLQQGWKMESYVCSWLYAISYNLYVLCGTQKLVHAVRFRYIQNPKLMEGLTTTYGYCIYCSIIFNFHHQSSTLILNHPCSM